MPALFFRYAFTVRGLPARRVLCGTFLLGLVFAFNVMKRELERLLSETKWCR
jgi:hypothetical protein